MICSASSINAKASVTIWKAYWYRRNGSSTLTGLANTEPYVGAQQPRAQGLQWFLSESNWQEREIQERRLQVLLEEPNTAPTGAGVLVIDEHGDRKKGHKTAHIGKQYLANLGKLDTGV